MKQVLVLAMSLTVGLTIQAQTDTIIQLDSFAVIDVPVQACDNYQSIEIDSITLKEFSASDLDQLLSSNSDVFIKDYGAGALSTASFRGLGSSHTQVYWNGIALNSSMNGTSDLSLIAIGQMDKVEVNYGAASMIDGAGSLGGSIKLQSQDAFNKKNGFTIGQSIGSFSTYISQASFLISNKRWFLKSSGQFTSSTNNFAYRNPELEGVPEEEMQGANYSKANASVNAGYMLGKSQVIRFNYLYLAAERNLPKLNTQSETTEFQEDASHMAFFNWTSYLGSAKNSLNAGFRYATIFYENRNIDIQSNSEERNFFVQDRMNYKLFKIEGTSSVLFDHIEANNEKYGSVKSRDQLQIIHDLRRKFNNRMTLGVVLKSIFSDHESLPILPSVNLGSSLLEEHVFVAANISYHGALPSMNDLYWGEGGNQDLKSETGLSSELNLRSEETINQGSFQFRSSGFYNAIDNWILWAPDANGIWRVDNVEEVEAYGIEVGLNVKRRIAKVEIGVDVNYNYNKTIDKKSKQLPYIPLHRVRGKISAGYKNIQLTYTQQLVGERYVNSENTIWMPAYSLGDVALQYEFQVASKWQMSLLLRCDNVGDVSYQSIAHRPMSGRRFLLSLKLGLNS